MSTFDGAFGNLHNFLHFIALNNCVDFDHHARSEEEELAAKGRIADVTQRKYSRLLFNAVTSLDAVLDYAFHAEGGGTDEQQREFNKVLFAKEPALAELREVSNAMKHCITRNSNKLNGEGVIQTRITGEVTVSRELHVDVHVQFEVDIVPRATDALEKAFRFWMTQGQQMNARSPRLDLSLP